MNVLKGPKCPICQHRISNFKIPENQPVNIFENCKRCKKEQIIFGVVPYIIFAFFIVEVFMTRQFLIKDLSSVLGITGALLLINNLTKLILAGVIYDGYEIVEKELPKIRKVNITGFLFLTAGFVLNYFDKNIILNLSSNTIVLLPFFNYVSLFLGAIIGLFVTQIYSYLIRAKIKKCNYNFIISEFNLGKLIKLNFKISGKIPPGICSLLIKYNNKEQYANWDQLPNPLKNDQAGQFAPELVPQTYYLPLSLGVEYVVPVLIQPTNKTEWNIFSGWWFDASGSYDERKQVNINSDIILELYGNTLIWKKKIIIKEIIG